MDGSESESNTHRAGLTLHARMRHSTHRKLWHIHVHTHTKKNIPDIIVLIGTPSTFFDINAKLSVFAHSAATYVEV